MSTSLLVLMELQDGNFHSGEGLANTLNISRSAIWKAIKSLLNKGVEIHSVRGRGYRLAKPFELLDSNKIKDYLSDSIREQFHIETHLQINSTNQYLLEHGHLTTATVTSVCMAEHQTAGRGRRGRSWVSPMGANLYMSLLWRYKVDMQVIAGFSLVSALAVIQGLENLGVSGLCVKWPNDILFNGRKLAGILLELAGEPHSEQRLVIGIGINVAMPDTESTEIDQEWTDLRLITGRTLSRNVLAAEILKQIAHYYAAYEIHGMGIFRVEWDSRDAYKDKPVRLIFPTHTIVGVERGIDPHGSLLLETAESGIRAYHSGEISLRPE